MSCLTVLGCERTNLPLVAPRVYLTAFGTSHTSNGIDNLHGGAAAFFWDQSVYATLQSLLDPVWMRGFLLWALGGGKFDNNLFVDLLANEPGGGYWYAFNTVSVFWMLEGYLSVTNDRELLYGMPINGESVSELLERLATNWTDPRWSSTSPAHKRLADYGGTADNFLECIPTYVHTTAALQAQNVHMLRSVARLREVEQNISAAARLRELSDHVAGAMKSQLYVAGPDGGFFGTVYPNGSLVTVRTCLDFMYVPHAISEDMPPEQRREMVAFFNRELRTPHWMRALSRSDPIAQDAETRRSDHGYTGAFSAWPALSAQSLALLAADESQGLSAAVVFLRHSAAATANGPYGQMQRLRPGDQPPFKDLLPKGTRFLANCGGAFADVMLRRLFGYLPTLGFEEPTLWRPGLSRAELAGRLKGVRLPNGSFADICADVAGVRFCRP
mmetsp:Transcript_93384/g.237707  ORF Transcript_93384/g.237707 Transcript_93384/m.237707 type:complete len:444 (+) Transcript_93384:1-1332(+)